MLGDGHLARRRMQRRPDGPMELTERFIRRKPVFIHGPVAVLLTDRDIFMPRSCGMGAGIASRAGCLGERSAVVAVSGPRPRNGCVAVVPFFGTFGRTGLYSPDPLQGAARWQGHSNSHNGAI